MTPQLSTRPATVSQMVASAAIIAVALVAAACGSSGIDIDTSAASEPTAVPLTDPIEADPIKGDPAEDAPAEPTAVPVPTGVAEPDPETTPEPIPVEPDGGIGDGAGPLPGADEPADPDGDWHGAMVAETNCPGTDFQRVSASAFTFSVPVDFVQADAQPVDSEVGMWSRPGIEVSYDYGWYSGPLGQSPLVDEVSAIDYGGFVGEFVVMRDQASLPLPNMVGVHFGEVVLDEGQFWNALNLTTYFSDPADEIIARCIASSVEWTVEVPG